MKNTVVIGAQWGDEGKAKITDLLAENADFIGVLSVCEPVDSSDNLST